MSYVHAINHMATILSNTHVQNLHGPIRWCLTPPDQTRTLSV